MDAAAPLPLGLTAFTALPVIGIEPSLGALRTGARRAARKTKTNATRPNPPSFRLSHTIVEVRPLVWCHLRQVLIADGIGALAGSLLGSPFPPAVYIGHPGWKAVGGRIGYSVATGVVISAVCFLGLTALLLAVVPLVAILPILLFIGLVIGAQAFEATPARHAPAVIIALLPNVAEWGQTQIDGALSAAGTSAPVALGYGLMALLCIGLARTQQDAVVIAEPSEAAAE